MPQYKVKMVAYTRYEAEVTVEAENKDDAIEEAQHGDFDGGIDWEEDFEYWEQKVSSCEEVKEKG